MTDRACEVCGGSMSHRTDKAVYCSPKCSNAAQVIKRTARRMAARAEHHGPCDQCGGPIPETRRVNAKFCTHTCWRAWRHAHQGRDVMREWLYGMAADDYDELLSQQDHRCAVCGTMEWGGKTGNPHVDHDHATGEVRGLLCASCNYGLGCFKDEAKRLRAAADYLDDRARFQACLED